jgi:prepilin-type N-terminal cleavage/methylation domain-containing protein
MLRSAFRRVTERSLGNDGFTLVEVIVAIAVIALLTGILIVNVLGRTADGNAASLLGSLRAIEDGVTAYRNDVRRYPTELVQLTTQPTAPLNDACTAPIPARFIAEWSGPYLSRQVTAAGIASGSSLIQNSLQRVVEAPDAFLEILVSDVDGDVAEIIKRNVDPDLIFTTGTIRWTEVGSTGRGELRYRMPVRGC